MPHLLLYARQLRAPLHEDFGLSRKALAQRFVLLQQLLVVFRIECLALLNQVLRSYAPRQRFGRYGVALGCYLMIKGENK